MVSRAKYRRVPELFVQGIELEVGEGDDRLVMWLQVPNPFEYDECRHDAQVARSRFTLAVKDPDSEEYMRIRGEFLRHGRDKCIENMLFWNENKRFLKVVDAVRNDQDWQERLEVAGRFDAQQAAPLSEDEQKLLTKINQEYIQEVDSRNENELDFERTQYEAQSDDELWESYLEVYCDQRGESIAMAEWNLTEVWYATRACDGVKNDEGQWDHDACAGHRIRVFEEKVELREAPEAFQSFLTQAMQQLRMSVRDAKNSGRQRNSSVSSPLPNEGAESTPSIPTETSSDAPGISPQPSLTH